MSNLPTLKEIGWYCTLCGTFIKSKVTGLCCKCNIIEDGKWKRHKDRYWSRAYIIHRKIRKA